MNNQISILVGGAGGLGRVVTRSFLEAGARVVVADANEESMSSLQEDLTTGKNLTCISTNVLDEKSIQDMAQSVVGAHGRVDCLINLVGGFFGGKTVADTPVSDWDRMMEMNLKSVFLCSKHVFPIMLRQKYGRIVNVGSRPALEGGAENAAYAASKAGVVNLTKSLAQEGLEHGITANAVLPSIIDTPINREFMADQDFSKWVTPEALARAILFLASPDSGDISGATIPIYAKS